MLYPAYAFPVGALGYVEQIEFQPGTTDVYDDVPMLCIGNTTIGGHTWRAFLTSAGVVYFWTTQVRMIKTW